MPWLFVYGSLKVGFPNFHLNRGRRLPGRYRTAQRYPLVLVAGRLPCLMPTPGVGHQVLGQVFDVTDDALAAMDALERVGQPGGYERIAIDIEGADGPDAAAPMRAFVYVQDPALLALPGTHEGPIAEYTPEHARRLRW